MTAPAPQIVYDNTTTDLGWTVGEGPPAGFGSQITLGGTGRVVTEFLFGCIGDADVKVDVKFHLNDGPHGGPGTVLFETGPSAIAGGTTDRIFSGLSVSVAQRLTPLLQAPPLGQHPEAVLRQRLLNAIAQYQAESRG